MATATTTTNPETLNGLIAAHRLAEGALEAWADQAGPLDDDAALSGRMQELADQILDHRPATNEETKAKCAYLLEALDRGADDFGKREMRQLLESLA